MKKLALLLSVVALFAFAGSAGATVVLFDDLTPGQNIEGYHFGEYGDGVTISSEDGQSTHVAGGDGVGYYSAPNAITNNGFLDGNALILTFDVPRGYLHFRVGDQGGDQDQVIVKAYDMYGNLIATWDSGLFGGNEVNYSGGFVDMWQLTTLTEHIKVVTIESIGPGAGIGLDDLVFCHPEPVPVPGAVWLLGSGLMGLVGLRRKFKK